ncbi:hypothetical protein B0A52_06428 [Exophiala mesophila]|uniref:NodB homology domain-containing protein n=1 Tax=Exophiala mesophila TaxID=212818 RepID=A0A438N2I8_EXOME|nr:hypothetical protein B0A52_06428 [Exophiala mesophila]
MSGSPCPLFFPTALTATRVGVAQSMASAVMEAYTAVLDVKTDTANVISPPLGTNHPRSSFVAPITRATVPTLKDPIAVLVTVARKMENVVPVKITGVGKDFCAVPDKCQHKYGFCDSDIKPQETEYFNSSADDRSHVGEIPYGKFIRTCQVPRLLGLSFDDGPSENTADLLDVLQDYNVRATFFVTGVSGGKGAIDQTDQWRELILRMVDEGHQVASHTWSHRNLNNLTSSQRWSEMVKLEQALFNIIGKYSNYVRPPYVQCNESSGCLKDLGDLGYHVIGWSIDSSDYRHENDLDAMIREFDASFDAIDPDTGSAIIIQHDTIRKSAIDLTKHIINRAQEKGFFPVPVSQCVGDEPEQSYRVAVKTDQRNETATTNESDSTPTPESSAAKLAPFRWSRYLVSLLGSARAYRSAPVPLAIPPKKAKTEL